MKRLPIIINLSIDYIIKNIKKVLAMLVITVISLVLLSQVISMWALSRKYIKQTEDTFNTNTKLTYNLYCTYMDPDGMLAMYNNSSNFLADMKKIEGIGLQGGFALNAVLIEEFIDNKIAQTINGEAAEEFSGIDDFLQAIVVSDVSLLEMFTKKKMSEIKALGEDASDIMIIAGSKFEPYISKGDILHDKSGHSFIVAGFFDMDDGWCQCGGVTSGVVQRYNLNNCLCIIDSDNQMNTGYSINDIFYEIEDETRILSINDAIKKIAEKNEINVSMKSIKEIEYQLYLDSKTNIDTHMDFLVFSVIITVIAISCTIGTIILMSKREFGILIAVGYTRKDIVRMLSMVILFVIAMAMALCTMYIVVRASKEVGILAYYYNSIMGVQITILIILSLSVWALSAIVPAFLLRKKAIGRLIVE